MREGGRGAGASTASVGGLVAGAFDSKSNLLGFVFGMTGVRGGQLAHWSHMLGVHESARNLGVGENAGRYVAGGGVGDHVPVGQTVAYPSYPPTSGRHAESPTTWGFHTDPEPQMKGVNI